jgi:hypothetical protein
MASKHAQRPRAGQQTAAAAKKELLQSRDLHQESLHRPLFHHLVGEHCHRDVTLR